MRETTLSRAFAAAKPLTKRARTQEGSENRKRVIRITVESFDPKTGRPLKKAHAEFATKFAPATRSAIDEIRSELGGRLEGKFAFATEQALTDAVVGVGAIASAINTVIPQGDAHYKSR